MPCGTPFRFGYPLIAGGELVGVLDLERYGAGKGFSRKELALASRFAPLAAVALRAASRRAALERLALTDELTNLPNRRCLERVLEREVARAERHQECLSLAVLDLEGLKPTNDTRGAEAEQRHARARRRRPPPAGGRARPSCALARRRLRRPSEW